MDWLDPLQIEPQPQPALVNQAAPRADAPASFRIVKERASGAPIKHVLLFFSWQQAVPREK